MEITRQYFCYNKSCRARHKGEVTELKLIGTVREKETENPEGISIQLNLYQCPTCKTVQLFEEEVKNA